MQIEYENGQMIITHQTGHKDTYSKADLETIKANTQKSANLKQDKVNILNKHIQNIEATISP